MNIAGVTTAAAPAAFRRQVRRGAPASAVAPKVRARVVDTLVS